MLDCRMRNSFCFLHAVVVVVENPWQRLDQSKSKTNTNCDLVKGFPVHQAISSLHFEFFLDWSNFNRVSKVTGIALTFLHYAP